MTTLPALAFGMLLKPLEKLTIMALAFTGPLAGASAAAKVDPKEVWPARDWQVAAPESQQVSAAGIERVRRWHEQNGTKIGLVIRHGRIIGEWYFDGAEVHAPLLVYSVTKSVSSTAVGIAMAKGKISLETRLGEFLPDLAPEEKKQITVGQLLSMTTGLHNNKQLDRVADQFRYAMFEAPLDDRPGEKWDYNNTGLSLLSPFFQAATGQPLDAFVAARIFKPIGVAPADWTWDRNADQPLPYSGLHITGRALARFGLMVLRGGRWRDKKIVPAEWLARASQPSQTLEKNYGFLWWNNSQALWRGVPAEAFAAIGKFENDMLIVPSLDLIVIRMVGDESGHEHKVKMDQLFQLVVDACETRPVKK